MLPESKTFSFEISDSLNIDKIDLVRQNLARQ